jgi:hypothetical protein
LIEVRCPGAMLEVGTSKTTPMVIGAKESLVTWVSLDLPQASDPIPKIWWPAIALRQR